MKYSVVSLASLVLAISGTAMAGTSLFVPSKYEIVGGYFQQDDNATDSSSFDVKKSNFGLFPNTTWAQLRSDVVEMNSNSPDNEAYKLFFLARHGEGYHNAAESFYGTASWDCYWSLEVGNNTNTWDDALLTPSGVNDSLQLGEAWERQLAFGAPFPQKFYSSPLRRTADTLNNTFANISLFNFPYSKPIFMEMIRETYGLHTCDERHNKTYITERYPNFVFEDGFAEEDELWKADLREDSDHVKYRANLFLNDIFANDSSTFISVTTHSGFIKSLLSLVNHRTFALSPGQMIPVIVKALNENRTDFTLATTTSFISGTAPSCSVNPTPTPDEASLATSST